MKLTVELIPKSSFFNNMRKVLTQENWDSLRRSVYREYKYKCGICGASGKMNCHEIWKFNDREHVQSLKGYIALCDMCHHVKHIGFAAVLAGQGKLDYAKVVDHFCKVNRCSERAFQKYVDKVFKKHEKRSKFKWTVDITSYKR